MKHSTPTVILVVGLAASGCGRDSTVQQEEPRLRVPPDIRDERALHRTELDGDLGDRETRQRIPEPDLPLELAPHLPNDGGKGVAQGSE